MFHHGLTLLSLALLGTTTSGTFEDEGDVPETPPAEVWQTVVNPAFPPEVVEAVPARRGRTYGEAELAPYFAVGALREARAAFEAGRYPRARELLSGVEQTLPVRYLAALSTLRAGDEAAAAPALEALAGEYAPLADRCAFFAGRARAALGDTARAVSNLESVPQGSRLYVDARVLLAKTLRTAKKLPAAREALAPFIEKGRGATPEVLKVAAELAKDSKDKAGELAVLGRLWAKFPGASAANEAEARVRVLRSEFTDVDLLDRAETLLDGHHNREVVTLLTPHLESFRPTTANGCRAHFLVGKALRKERAYDRAISALQPLSSACGDPEIQARALYILAQAQASGQPAAAVDTYLRLAKVHESHAFADDALYFAGELASRVGNDARALELLERVTTSYPGGDYAAEALFKRAWILRRSGKLAEAAALLAQARALPEDNPESQLHERATYWHGRVLHASGDLAGASEAWSLLLSSRPVSYYGWLARERMAKVDPAAAAKAVAAGRPPGASRPVLPAHAGTLDEDPHFLAAVELYRMGFLDAVAQELLAASRAQQPAEALKLVVYLLDRSGETRTAHWVARTALKRELGGRISEDNRALWEMAYPPAFRELVEKHARAAKIDPDLLQGLMREESALDPRAVSWAGALGLTQLMPFTAKAVARKLKLSPPSRAELFEPELNLQLGATFLGQLVSQFDGELRYAVGSYNAGPNAIKGWVHARPLLETDEWVEEIPIAETRGYVKRVLRSYTVYQLLGSAGVPVLNAASSGGGMHPAGSAQ